MQLEWKDPTVQIPPPRQNLLVYRDPEAVFWNPKTKQKQKERRQGVNSYDLDVYAGLEGKLWAYQAGSAIGNPYSHYCELPPHPLWRFEELPSSGSQIVWITEGNHRGEFLTTFVGDKRVMFLGNGFGWTSLQNPKNLVRCWLPVPPPPHKNG